MIPLGPKWLALNSAVSAAGLSIFFFLSGFLIVSMLSRNLDIPSFLIRRLFRIAPLAWLALVVLAAIDRPTLETWLVNAFFFANLVPGDLMPAGEHLWSLSVEVQFYLAIAVAALVLGRRAFALLPFACLAITGLRIAQGAGFSIVTWLRVDEILVGGIVALVLHHSKRARASAEWPVSVTILLLPVLLLCCHERFHFANYMRPYATALVVYSSLFRTTDALYALLVSPLLTYFAKTSYALYIVHPLTYAGWMGEGDVVVRYTKRVFSFALTFLFAHLLSNHYEQPINRFGHRLADWFDRRKRATAGPIASNAAPAKELQVSDMADPRKP